MTAKSTPPCRHLLFKDHISYEVGGGSSPTVIPNVIPNCGIDLLEVPVAMDWAKCKQTPFDGPCWQHLSMNSEEWSNFVRQRIQELKGG